MRILHAADFHLDSIFGDLSEEQAALRRKESNTLIEKMVDYANENGADLILLAGDIFDTSRVTTDTINNLAEAFARFHGQICISPGNHDYYDANSSYAKPVWPANTHIFTKNTMESLHFESLHCTVYGRAFTKPEELSPLILPRPEEGISIALLHADLGVKDSHYGSLQLSDIRSSDFTYVALGHIHQGTGVQFTGRTAYAYPGCIEGRGFDELGEKGFLFGDIDAENVNLRFVPFARYRYYVITADVTGRLIQQVTEEAVESCTEFDSCRIVLTGETEEKDIVPEQDLYRRLYYLEIRNKTVNRRDIWLEAGNDSLKGIFLSKLKQQLELTEDPKEKEKILHAARYGIAAMENQE